VFRLPAELVPTLPEPVRAVVRNAVWSYGAATHRVRPLPDFLILGAQKAGTTALYAYLRWHPRIAGPSWKEVSYFDRHYARGPRWYRGQFPNRFRARGKLVGEASPSYLFHPQAPARVAELLPDARLVALLRNPVDRAYSQWQHARALGREPLAFPEALEAEEERTRGETDRMAADPRYFSHEWWDHTYFARGLYAEQLERWYEQFPRERLLVVLTEEYASDPAGTYARVLSFLGAPQHELREHPRIFSRDYEPLDPAARAALEERYAEPNRRLAALLGRELPWR
jgi:hypothetical protein